MLKLDWNLLWNVINLIILYLLMRRFLIGPVIAIMDQRRIDIESRYEQADRVKMDADSIKAEYEQKLRSVQTESECILEQAQKNSRTECERLLGEADIQAAKTLEQARQQIKQEREQMQKEVRGELASLVMAAAGKVIGSQNQDQIDQYLYAEFLNETGEEHDAALN